MNLASVFKPFIVCDALTSDPCDYTDLIELVNVLIQNIVVASTFVVVVLLIFAGFKLIFSGGDKSAMESAKKMLTNVVIGYLWILSAWLVVYTIMSTLVKDDFNQIVK